MVTFRASKEELKKSFSVVSQAVDRSPITPVDGQALIKVEPEVIRIYTTNKDMLASAHVQIALDEGNGIEFTVDPRQLLNLIESADIELITFKYDPDKKTLQVFAAEDPESYVSFPSLDPDTFLSFTSEIEKAIEIKRVDAQVFLYGIQFILGFLPDDSKNKRFQNAYIDKGFIYGSDGSTRMGAFSSSDFDGIDYLILRKAMIPQIAAMVREADLSVVVLKYTSKIFLISSEDGVFNFGFSRATKEFEPPKFNIDLKGETAGGINLNKDLCLKRMKRLSIPSEGTMGVNFQVEADKMKMRALSERDALDSMPVKVIQEGKVEFTVDYKAFKNILGLFKASNVDIRIHSKGNRFQMTSEGELVIGSESPVKKPFLSTAIVSMSRVNK